MWIITNGRKFLKTLKYQNTYLPPERPVSRSRNSSEKKDTEEQMVWNWKTNKQTPTAKKNLLYCHPVYLTYTEHILENAVLEETQAEFKRKIEISIKISITSDMQMIPPIWHKAKITKEPLDVGERGEWKSWLKTQHSKN